MSRSLFFAQSLQDFKSIGSFVPSSQALCQSLCTHLRYSLIKPQSSPSVLEVGSGTGVVATYILREKYALNILDVVESQADLFDVACKNIQALEASFPVRLFNERVEAMTWPEPHVYDAIISSIPLNSLAIEDVRDILLTYKRLLKQGGSFSFYEYLGSRLANSLYALIGSDEAFSVVLGSIFVDAEINTAICWNNFPPARVITVKV